MAINKNSLAGLMNKDFSKGPGKEAPAAPNPMDDILGGPDEGAEGETPAQDKMEGASGEDLEVILTDAGYANVTPDQIAQIKSILGEPGDLGGSMTSDMTTGTELPGAAPAAAPKQSKLGNMFSKK